MNPLCSLSTGHFYMDFYADILLIGFAFYSAIRKFPIRLFQFSQFLNLKRKVVVFLYYL